MRTPRDLTRAMLAFGAILRASGLPVTTGALTDAVRALQVVDLFDRDQVYLALLVLLVSRIEEQGAFDRCFNDFWKFRADGALALDGTVGTARNLRQEEEPEPNQIGGGFRQIPTDSAFEDWGEEEPSSPEAFDLPGQSSLEVLIEQDFSTFPAEQLAEVARLTVQIAKQLASRLSRRRKPTRRRGAVDIRRSMRANLMRGEIIELRRRARRRRKVQLVLICDVSGSMDLYSCFLLQFLYALQNVFGRVETFTFATRLTRISDLLRASSYKSALRRLSSVRDWSGGTRIGDSLREFNAAWGRLVDRRTIVLLLSDGWDTGDPEMLAQEMLTLKQHAGRIIWLNPLLGDPSYEPLTRGMVAALPLVHHFAAAHNLASLRKLAGYLTLR
jgi:uncharacterized protein with von Willebrand factor type A (vWA) domain